jgi:hypothetical protein
VVVKVAAEAKAAAVAAAADSSSVGHEGHKDVAKAVFVAHVAIVTSGLRNRQSRIANQK